MVLLPLREIFGCPFVIVAFENVYELEAAGLSILVLSLAYKDKIKLTIVNNVFCERRLQYVERHAGSRVKIVMPYCQPHDPQGLNIHISLLSMDVHFTHFLPIPLCVSCKHSSVLKRNRFRDQNFFLAATHLPS